MEETYYLRQPNKRRQRKPAASSANSASKQNTGMPSIQSLQQQYGGDQVELVASDGEVRSINFSDFSFN